MEVAGAVALMASEQLDASAAFNLLVDGGWMANQKTAKPTGNAWETIGQRCSGILVFQRPTGARE
jgi:hypothetical protein